MTESDTHIDRVRVRAPKELATQVQLRLEAQLAGADVRPPGLAPSQVLLVREVSDPAPGRLSIDRPSPGVDRDWERSVRDALLDCLHEAARPQNGWVPSGVNAVLFSDEAEAWASWSLAASSADPGFQQPWWMKGLERSKRAAAAGQSPGRAVSRVWASQPHMLPGLLTYVAGWDGLVATLKSLSEEDAASLRRRVCKAFGVDPPAETPDVALGAVQTPHRDEGADRSGGDSPDGTDPISTPSVGLPWAHLDEVSRLVEPVVREVDVDAWAERLELLGVALTLHAGPSHVRSRPFRRQWRRWRALAADPDRSFRPVSHRPSTSGARMHSGQVSEDPVSAPRGPSDTRGEGTTTEAASTDAESEERTDPYIRTELGGVFYLMNALAAFELPGSSDTPPLGGAGGWAVLEAVARSLLAEDDNREERSDPLWRLLARLDGREPDAPANLHSASSSKNGAECDRCFRAPVRWIEEATSSDDRTARWTVADGRLLLWMPGVGPVVDLPVREHPERRAEEEWTRVSDAGALTRVADASGMPVGAVPTGCGSALAFWASRFVPFLEARVRSALDGSVETMASLLQVPGRVYSSATHVDVVLPLEAARIEVRRAGLDRSPGWWAAGGRVVQIHFRSTETGSE